MEDIDSMKFRQQLLVVDENLGKDEVEALKFLCIGLVSLKKLESVKSAQEIFQLLIINDLLHKDDFFIIAELLYRIKFNFLLHKLGYTKEEIQEKLPLEGRVSEYRNDLLTLPDLSHRQMLYEISEGLSDDDLRSAMFLLRDRLPKRLSTMSALELLSSLEKQDLLSNTNLCLLEEICSKISPGLVNTIDKYKQKQASKQEGKESAPSSVRGFSEQSFENFSLPVSLQEPSIGYGQKTCEFGHQRECVGSLRSFATNQDVKAGNETGFSEMSWQPSVGDEESKTTAEKPARYKMDGPYRGHCLIFNNINFVGTLSLTTRMGSQKDAMELERVFTWLGLDVKRYDDQTSVDMMKLLESWQSSETWRDRDCLVCCILSHGESGKIYGTDSGLIPIRTIMSYFTAKRCPLLAKKPKLFFIQACQGKQIQQPVLLDADTYDPMWLQSDAQTSGAIASQQMRSSIPEEADFLLGMATVDGYISFRHKDQGTWYIQALCSKLQTLVPRGEDILSILTEVNDDVSKRADTQGIRKQMPQPAYTLRRKLIFPVPRDPFPLSE